MTAPPRALPTATVAVPLPGDRDRLITALMRAGRPPAHVAAVGMWRRTWTADDVTRVAATLTTPRPAPAPSAPAPAPRPAAPDRTSGSLRTPAVTRLWSPPQPAGDVPTATITPMQARVLDGICEGLTNAQIATRLDRTEDTIKTHVRRLFRTLGARDRAHAAALAAGGARLVLIRQPARRTDTP